MVAKEKGYSEQSKFDDIDKWCADLAKKVKGAFSQKGDWDSEVGDSN